MVGNEINEVKELRMWSPSIISQIMFCYFSPLQVFVVLAADNATRSIISSLVIAYGTAFLLAFLCHTFKTWNEDQGIIYKKGYEEGNRFMLSQTAKVKADAAIQADSLDTREPSILYSPYSPPMVIKSPSSVSTGTQPRIRKKPKSLNPFQQGDL